MQITYLDTQQATEIPEAGEVQVQLEGPALPGFTS